jgi:phosphoribosyl 1,2-cyclic phosphodiesterase
VFASPVVAILPAVPGETRVKFWGVRGSTPCDGERFTHYGGDTSCVEVTAAGHPTIVFDLGTGLRSFGAQVASEASLDEFSATVLLTHLHWDHIQGLPFFAPVSSGRGQLEVYGPRQPEGTLLNAFAGVMRPPYFPITPDQLAGQVDFVDVGHDDFVVDGARVRSRWVRHCGPTLGFRVEIEGVSIAYVSDHGPGCSADPDDFVPLDVLELCDGVDLLIHDAQHRNDEFEPKRKWGHSTVDYAVHVAHAAGARRLVLFHHCPTHADADLDLMTRDASELASRCSSLEVITAAQGLELVLADGRCTASA